MMMYSVELYRQLGGGEFDPGWTECGGIRLACTPGALGGDAAPGRLGEDVRPAARADLRRGGAGAVPADGHRRRDRRVLAADRRLPRSQPAHLRARRRRAPGRLRDLHPHARHRDRRRARRGHRRAHRARRHRVRGRRQRRRHVRGRDRPAGRRAHPDRADGARVPRHPAVPRARRRAHRHDARPRPPRSTSARRAAGS